MSLITTIEEMKTYCAAASLAADEDNFQTSVQHVEEMYLVPEIGQELYDELTEAYNESIDPSPTALTAEEAALLAACRKVVAPLAMVHYKNSVIAQISEAGAVEKNAESGSQVRMWVNKLQTETLMEQGFRAIEPLLRFLETNKADYPTWAGSSAYTLFNGVFCRSADEMNDYVFINKSRQFFRSLAPDLRESETALAMTIGEEFYEELLANREDGSATTEELKVIILGNKYVSHAAIANSTLVFEQTKSGAVRLFAETETAAERLTLREAMAARQKEFKQAHARKATMALDNLMNYLQTTASNSVFQTFFESDKYSTETTDSLDEFNADSAKSFHF